MKKNLILFSLLFAVIFTTAFTTFNLTRLIVTVVDNQGNRVEGAEVKLFETKEDFDALENEIADVGTDEKGKVTIKDLDPKVYYISVVKGDLNNYGNAEKTDELLKNKFNKITVVISDF